jgi:hypothetical protein
VVTAALSQGEVKIKCRFTHLDPILRENDLELGVQRNLTHLT